VGTLLVLCLALVAALLAHGRGRNPVAWFLIAVFFNVFALLLLLLLPDLTVEAERERRRLAEQERLAEEFKAERGRVRTRLAEAEARLDTHDRLAGVDTHPAPLAPGRAAALPSAGVPPLPNSSAPRWYFEYEGEPRGPEALSSLRLRLTRGEIGPETLVWREGLDDWTPAGSQPEFSA
jgi:hypothetical protein